MNPGEYEWLDAPFFNLLNRFSQIQNYFTGVTWSIAKVVVTLCLGFMFLRYALTGEGLKENLTKFLLSFVIYAVVIGNYPRIITGINELIYEFSVESTYVSVGEDVKSLQEYAEKVRREHEETAMAAAAAEAAAINERNAMRPNAMIISTVKEKENNGESFDVSSFIEEDLFHEETKYIRPNGMVKLIMMVCGEIWNNANSEGRGIGQMIMDALCVIAVVLCGIFGSVQYFVGALEFSLVTAIGVIFLPFMLWDGTKFITEKFIGALLGFFLKMLFLTICLLFMYYGFLELTLRPYTGALEQIIYFIFSAVFYMMITQNGPKLAVTLLTGTPQMSLMEVAQAAGVYGGAAMVGKKAAGTVAGAAGRGAARGGFAAAGAHARAKGAADFVKSEGGTKKDQSAAYRSSVMSSMKEGAAGRAANVGRSLLTGGSGVGHGGGGSGGLKGYNRFSQRERFNQPNEKGQNLTMKEHLGKQHNAGQEDGLNYMIKKEERAQRMNPPPQGRSLGGAGSAEGGEKAK